MANNAKITVESQLNYGPGSFIRRKADKNDVYILVEANKRIANTQTGYVLDPANGSCVCIALNGSGNLINIRSEELESFAGKITITV